MNALKNVTYLLDNKTVNVSISLYDRPASKSAMSEDGGEGRKEVAAAGREGAPLSPALAFRRDQFDSAVGSRAADAFQTFGASPRRRVQGGGGIQYIEPPNRRKSNDYFYYSDNSPYYKVRLSIKPSALRRKNKQRRRSGGAGEDQEDKKEEREIQQALPSRYINMSNLLLAKLSLCYFISH